MEVSFRKALGMAAVLGTFLVAGLGTFAITQALAHPDDAEEQRGGFGMRRGGLGMMGPGMMGFGQLDLSEGQRQAIRALVEQHRGQLQPVLQQMREAQRALREATAASPLDETLVRQRAAELASLQADAMVLRTQLQQEIHGLLTAEQQATLEALQEQRRQRMQERRERFEQRRQQRRPGGVQPQIFRAPRSPFAPPANALV